MKLNSDERLKMLIKVVEEFLKRKVPISTLRRAVKEAKKEVQIMETKSCEERVLEHFNDRIKELEILFRRYQRGEEDHPELGSFLDYGLCFDYVPPYTFKKQKRGYFRYQISYGGPQEEFRFITDDPHDPAPPIEFWLLDWFDGAKIKLLGKKYNILLEIWHFFQDTGETELAFRRG